MKIEKVLKNTNPFDFFTFKNIFTENEIDEIYLLFENHITQLKDSYNITGRRSKYNNRIYLNKCHYERFSIVKELIDTLREFFKETFKPSNDKLFIRTELIMDNEGFWLEPHVDIPEKKLSMMIYLNRSNDEGIPGTTLYDNNLNEIYETPYKNNTGFYFFPSENTWHGVKTFKDKKRMALMINVTTFETEFELYKNE
jgi:hypothetical protein